MDKVPAWFLDLCEGPASKIEGVWVSTHLVSLVVSQEGRRAGRRPPRHERHRPHSTRDAKEGTFEATVRGTRSVTLESVPLASGSLSKSVPRSAGTPRTPPGFLVEASLVRGFRGDSTAPVSAGSPRAPSFRQSAFGSQRCRITQCEGERKRLEEDRERGTVDQDLWWR